MTLFPLLLGCQTPLQKFDYVRPKMGTGFHIVLYAADSTTANRAADAAFSRIDDLNATLSDYDPNTELSRLSHATDQGPMASPVTVSRDLWNVVERSVEASRRSDGAFDITLGPCIKLWRRSRDLGELPSPERLAEARLSVGWQAIRLSPQTHSIQLLKPKMRLDVGGIAKGYAATEALLVIRGFGITRAMVGAAGDESFGDPPPGKSSWRVAIQSLADPEKTSAYVNLRNAAISTSGDTERFIVIGGQRYSHIIDPRTGLGLTQRIGVTVLSPNGIDSDWLTKPASVLGPEEGLKLIDATPGAAGRIDVLDGRRETVYESKRWREFVSDPAD